MFLRKINDNTKIIRYVLYALAILISALGFILYALKTTGNDIWYDEVFSVVFAGRSYGDIVSLTASDVHPPFYYFYLKALCDFSKALFPEASVISIGKLASLLPLVVMQVLAFTVVRKRHGAICALTFSMLITFMPQLSSYYVEIRMYSLAMMLVFIAFIAGERIISEARWYDYVIFTIFGLLTAYTQYYACVVIVGIYFLVGIISVIKKNVTAVIGIIICAIASVVLYIPWIPKLIYQVSEVSGSYWIQPMNFKSIFGCIKFMYLPMPGTKGYLVAAAAILASAVLFVWGFFAGKRDSNFIYMSLGGAILIGLIVCVGFVCSIMGRPIFVYRYMLPAIGVYYLGLASLIERTANIKLLYVLLLLVPFVFTGYYSTTSFAYEENIKLSKIPEALNEIDKLPEDGIIITNFDQVGALMDYYLPKHKIYVYEGTVDNIVALMYDNDGQYLSKDSVADLVKNNSDVYFFGSFNSREDILNEWCNEGITNTEVADSCLIERYYFNIYKLKYEQN